MDEILAAILDDDRARVKDLLKRDCVLATCLIAEAKLYKSKIDHWTYVGDTASHQLFQPTYNKMKELLTLSLFLASIIMKI
jgi:hypothetical protein